MTLKIYDISGREILTLIDGEVPAGFNRITYNAYNISSGIYFYSLKSDKYTETRKMILIK